MPASVCRYEKNTECVLLKTNCEPGRKGCVIIRAGYKLTIKPDLRDKKESRKKR